MEEAMVKLCFNEASQIYQQCKEKINERASFIAKETGMNENSARDYMQDFFIMLTGGRLKRAMAENDARYYFDQMHAVYGENALHNAISSLEKYLNYDNQKHPSLQKLVDEFKKTNL